MRTCSIITGEPNELVRKIHTRMPVILPEDKLDVWLCYPAKPGKRFWSRIQQTK